jgi:hypothetical protein
VDEARRVADFRGQYDPAEDIHRLDLIFVHLKRGGPILGEMVRKGKGEIGIHVIYGPRNKVGQMLVVPTDNLQPYKVSSMQLKGAFPQGKVPEELLEKGTAYLVTDKPTMYPDFSSASIDFNGPTKERDPEVAQARQSLVQQPASDSGGEDPVAKLKSQWGVQSGKPSFGGEDPNMTLARDFLKQGQESRPSSGGGGRREREQRSVPMSLGIRRRFGNSGV